MAKIRVFQLATELNFDKNELVALCKSENFDVKSPLSSVDDDLANQIRALVEKKATVKEAESDGVIRSMKDLPTISSDDLERGKVALSQPSQESSSSGDSSKDSGASKTSDSKSQKVETPPPAMSTTSQARPPVWNQDQNNPGRKRTAMTEFERQQAKIQKRKKQKEKASARAQKREEQALMDEIESKTVRIGDGASPAELSESMKIPANELISTLFSMGIMASINQKLDLDTCTILTEEFGFSIADEESQEDVIELDFDDHEDSLELRDPVVTVMGHVDHGKTTLLDYIRKANVTDGEAGGITQHIGAYKVTTPSGQKICFLDTPGHEAFTAMRAHGSQITDIAILVVAADDSVKPQTLEAINHAKNADVPIIVAITKCDKPDVNLQKVYEDLGANGLIVEAWGGNIVSQPVSGITGEGIGELLDLLALQSEMLELKANPNRNGVGVVVEAGMHKGRGSVATILVQKGEVNVGDIMVAGTSTGRVRSMVDDHGKRVKTAGPSTPVEITGFSEVPQFADKFYIVESDKVARTVVEDRQNRLKDLKLKGSEKNVSLESLFAQVEEGRIKDLKVIVKTDVHGSLIALTESLEKIQAENVRVKVVHSGVGAVSESDIMLAAAADAVILCFHVRADGKIRNMADEHGVEIRMYRIIYEALEEIEAAINGMLEPKYEEIVLGRATIKDVFAISKVGKIAGCFVDSGKIIRGKDARLIRDGIEVYVGKVENLNRFKDTVTEVLSGYECGINLRYNDVKIKDIIEVYEMKELPRN